MSRVVIVTDSTADFPKGALNGQRIRVVAGHTPDAFLNAYKKAGPKILSLSAPMKLGGDFLPAERAKEKVPFHFEVRTLDSQTLSLGLGFMVMVLAEKAEAKELAKRLKAVYPGRHIPIVQTGTIIGTHSGPGLIGICGLLK